MERLDKELLNRNLCPTRTKAQELIKNGLVTINDKIITKTGYCVNKNDIIKIQENEILKYVSRAGLKLEKAITSFNLDFKNKCIMDIGSSTGGFTDCSIQNGAKKVIAIDVGTDLMDKNLRNNNKIELHEQTNIQIVSEVKFTEADYITIDVSFVSLEKIFEKIASTNTNADIIALIKPQFECGKEIAKKYKGIILNPSIHKTIINNIINIAKKLGLNLQNLDYSPIKGGDGNIEYISYFSKKLNNNQIDIDKIINNAFDN